MSLAYNLRKQPRHILLAAGLLLLVAAVLIDRLAGNNLSFLLFYLIPVYFFIWFISRRFGVIVSIASALIWLLGNIIERSNVINTTTSYLNLSIELVFFFLVTYLLCVLKEALGINEELIRTDLLTGVMNRNAFYDLAGKEIWRLERYQRPFTIAYVDIDNFKIINYRLGNQAGDHLLRSVSDTMCKNLRKVDLVSRFGGDEFTILLPETGAEAAQVVLSRMRNVLLNVMEKNGYSLTFTFGTVTFLKSPGTVEEMMKKVSSVMYAAKDSGMNTIEHEVCGT
ncbi:MAG: GGDEF domain-containing protein [Candidatus Omnitrophica bacterium]|nr:GGDEF domain-containing protein [Candidatus Omnitrophota bacterium]